MHETRVLAKWRSWTFAVFGPAGTCQGMSAGWTEVGGQLPPNSKKPSCGKVRVFIKHRQEEGVGI